MKQDDSKTHAEGSTAPHHRLETLKKDGDETWAKNNT